MNMETFKEISSLFALIDIFLILFELHILLKKLFHVSSFKGKIRSFIVSFIADCCVFSSVDELIVNKSYFLQYVFYFCLFILLMLYPCRRFIKKKEVKKEVSAVNEDLKKAETINDNQLQIAEWEQETHVCSQPQKKRLGKLKFIRITSIEKKQPQEKSEIPKQVLPSKEEKGEVISSFTENSDFVTVHKNVIRADSTEMPQVHSDRQLKKHEKTDIEFSDEIYIKALEVFSVYPEVSTTRLQRKLKLGYDSAVKIIDVLEEKGFIRSSGSSSLKTFVYSPSELKYFNFIVSLNPETEKHEEKKDALQFAKEIYYKENSENLEKFSDEYCSKQAECINWFYNEIKGFSVSLVKSEKSFEENKIKYIIALSNGTTTANIKYCKKELAEYLNVNSNDLKIDFSNPETGTLITIPFPNPIINMYRNSVPQEKE